MTDDALLDAMTTDERDRYTNGNQTIRDRILNGVEMRRDLDARDALNLNSRFDGHAVYDVLTAIAVLTRANVLTDREREIWVDRNIIGISLAQLADRHDLTRTRVAQIEHAAERKIRPLLARLSGTDLPVAA